jgi:thiamine-phosphate diphosphorylase
MNQAMKFPKYPKNSIGFYPIVPDLEWLIKLVEWGAQTIQLRIKEIDLFKSFNNKNEAYHDLSRQIQEASDFCKKKDVALIVNDHWYLASKYGAFGIHLGQEDLDVLSEDDLKSIKESRMIVGISTHNFKELERALKLEPSYIALGPVFPTTCKSLSYGPHGLGKIKEWCQQTSIPIVAIGGMKAEHIKMALENGASGIAVISDILKDPKPEHKVQEWLRLFREFLKKEKSFS